MTLLYGHRTEGDNRLPEHGNGSCFMLGITLEAREPSQAGTGDRYFCGLEPAGGIGSPLADVPNLVHGIPVHKARVQRWQRQWQSR